MKSSAVPSPFLTTATLRRSLTSALALTVILSASGAAQESPKSYKKWYLGVGGALLVGLPVNLLVPDENFDALSFVVGGTIGFLIGSEMDRVYDRRMAAGPTLDYSFRNVPLDLVPDRIAGFPGGAAVIGVGGARIVGSGGLLETRGTGVRGIEDAEVMPDLNLLVLSTFSNLISFPLQADTTQGRVLDQRGGGQMELFDDRLAVAGFDSLRLLGLNHGPDEFSVQTLAAFENLDFVTDLEFNRSDRIGWILMGDRLASYTPDLERVGEITLPAAGLTVRAAGTRLAVAAGTEGVYVLDATDPAVPRVVQHYTRVRYAYAADLDGDRLYIAAGSEGVPVVDVSGEIPKVIGVARETSFAIDVVTAGPGRAWILDRDGQSVQIADFGITGSRD
jgi:hypothetical protein